MSTTPFNRLSNSPEKLPISLEIAEYILRNPAHVFEEYEKTLKLLAEKSAQGQQYRKSEVTIFYRNKIADKKSPTFTKDIFSIGWLINQKQISSPTELVTMVEGISGLKAADLEIKSSEEVEEVSRATVQSATAQLPTTPDEDNDISGWLIEETNRSNQDDHHSDSVG